MSETYHSNTAREILQAQVGVIIPLYMGAGTEPERARDLAADNVAAYVDTIRDPRNICIAVDGEDCGGDIGREIAEKFGTSVAVCPKNLGKLQALRAGIGELRNPQLKWIACVDQDGDHFANELLNLLRGALHMRANCERILVIGGRSSRHRPMGFLRGELEDMADRVLLDAMHYHAAQTGRPLRLEYSSTLEEFPDFHSGYKLFCRATADAIAHAEPVTCAESADCYYRHAVEAVLTIEALLAGATLGSVNRSTFNEQPISAFGQLRRTQLVADKVIWPCKRLGIPGHFVLQWVDNHLPRLLLGTLVPTGAEELATIRRLIAEAFGLPHSDAGRPLFL
ncbi:MAG: hypothetical protein ACI8W8_002132 [Rhodothermales bacterium]